jgi:hypothetical protein
MACSSWCCSMYPWFCSLHYWYVALSPTQELKSLFNCLSMLIISLLSALHQLSLTSWFKVFDLSLLSTILDAYIVSLEWRFLITHIALFYCSRCMLDLLRPARMSKWKSMFTPMSPTEHFLALMVIFLDAADSTEYRNIVWWSSVLDHHSSPIFCGQ